MNKKYNVLVGQSGGPTSVINGSLYGVIKESLNHTDLIDTIYGMINGIEGFINEDMLNISKDMSDEDIELLKTTPASYLGSCRFKLPADLNNNIYNTIFSLFEKYNIMYFLYIGGNDSMDTVAKLSAYAAKINSPVRIIGVPKTIDNDLVHTDHSPGYGSAAKFVASVVRDIALDSGVYKQDSVTIIEIMGRHAGWLTAASALARKFKGDNPILIYLPERAFDVEEFIKSIKNALSYTNNVVICVSEGIKDSSGRFICEYESNVKTDNFGHKMLTGCGKYLEGLVKDRLGIKVRSIELNVTQRCVSSFISETDVLEAISAGEFGVQSALKGITGVMIAFKRNEGTDYSVDCITVDCSKVCNFEQKVPDGWINSDGTDVNDNFISYALPLIQGELRPPIKNGLPVYAYRK
ncbi:MAG: 6-phosphofructokinase [Lachnospiraceae bacterium]|nr:6-phosphofructokinase [Lachnospiraceae bacterium]